MYEERVLHEQRDLQRGTFLLVLVIDLLLLMSHGMLVATRHAHEEQPSGTLREHS